MTQEAESFSNNDLNNSTFNQKNHDDIEIKEGEFMITCLHALLINKTLPVGYKLELEMVYEKTAEQSNVVIGKKRGFVKTGNEKKPKKKGKKLTEISNSDSDEDEYTDDKNNSNMRLSQREKKPNHKEDLGFVESKNKCKDPKLNEISKKCEKIFMKLKKHPLYDFFSKSDSQDAPNLNEVEKKIRLCLFNTIHMFALEVRKVFKYYFSRENSESYKKVFDFSQFFEEIFNENEDITSIDEINKKLMKLENKIQKNESMISQAQGIYGNSSKSNMSMNISRQPALPLSEKPMTITEKNILGNKIKMLNQDQMKGILHILSDQCSIDNNSKFFEFDIDTLSTKKLRDLEKYVKKCLKENSSNSLPVTSLPKQIPIQQAGPVKNQNFNPKQKEKETEGVKEGKDKEIIENKVKQIKTEKEKEKIEVKPIQQSQMKEVKQQINQNQILQDSLSSSESEDDDSGMSSLDFRKIK